MLIGRVVWNGDDCCGGRQTANYQLLEEYDEGMKSARVGKVVLEGFDQYGEASLVVTEVQQRDRSSYEARPKFGKTAETYGRCCTIQGDATAHAASREHQSHEVFSQSVQARNQRSKGTR
jgi:hypothetical protein